MFKGLKLKLEDEAKKIQASMQQYGEQLTQQVDHIRGATSDAGSEGGSSITRRFLSSVGGSSAASPSSKDLLNQSEDSLGLDSSSRQRRLSDGSTHSTESSLSVLFQSVPGLAGTTLDTAGSDSETIDEYGSGVIRSATKDQISSVLSRLQGRASTYKDKYRDLVKKYNDVVTENNKCRTVLAQTQDKALDRIEKLKRDKKVLGEKLRELEESQSNLPSVEHKQHRLEEMLEKCKLEITKNRAKIKELTQENEKLSLNVQAAESESDISTLVADRVANEWKQRIDRVEEEWTERMNKNEADHAIQLATTKADMHAALEAKDKEIESWRSKCHALELQDGQANERWQKKVDELQKVIQALEVEKGDMIEKLSAAKLQGVKAVRDEEERKREELVAEFAEKEERLQREFEKRMKDFESEKEEEALYAERKMAELKDSLISAAEKHQAEVAELMQEHDEIVSSTRKQQLIELEAVTAKLELAREEADKLRLKNDTLEKQLEQLDESYTSERAQSERVLQDQIDELMEKLRTQEAAYRSQDEGEMAAMRDSYTRLCETNDDLKKKLDEVTSTSAGQLAEAKELEEKLRAELSELRTMLESRNAEFYLVEMRKQELEEEIAAAHELSAINDRLRAELEETRKQREAESLVSPLRDRAGKGEEGSKEDCTSLEKECFKREMSSDERKGGQCLDPILSESELEGKDGIPSNVASISELSAQTAGEMCTSDELQQLRSEVAHLSETNTRLAAKINQLEAENSKVMMAKDETQRLLNELKSASETMHGRVDELHQVGSSGDEIPGNSPSAEYFRMENLRLSEELKRNEGEILLARDYKATLEKELLELKSQVAERHSKLDGADVLISLQEENKSGQNEDGELHPNGSHHRIALLEEQLRVQLDEVERLSQLATSESRRADEAQNVLKEKAAELESLMREIKQKDGIIAGLEDELEKVSREEKALRTQCADYENHCRQLESRIGELVQEQEKLHSALIEERGLVESSTASLRQLQNSLAEEEKRALELQHVLEEKLTQSASLESEAELKEEQLKREISLRKDQENLVTELRKEIERIHSEHKEDVAAELSKLNSAQAKIEQLVAKEAEDKKLLVDMQSKVVIAEEKLRDIEKTREQEKFEEERIREQYASALENVKQELADAHKRIRMTEASETESVRLKQELEQIRKKCEENAARHQEETDATVKQLRSKAEKKIAKIKAAAEKDVSSVKAELLLEVDQLRRDVSDRDRRIDELTLEKARTEQQLIAQQQLEEELEQRRLKEKEMNESRKSIERRILELEAGNQLLEKKNIELNEYKEKSEAQAEESDRNLKELQEKIRTLEGVNEEGFRKAAVKQDTDNKKAVRELQREVRQLYVELNEKTDALDVARSRISELESNPSKSGEEVAIQSQIHEDNVSPNYGHEEELESMRRKLKECHSEIDRLQETNTHLQRLVEHPNQEPNSPAVVSVKRSSLYDGMGFADPAEAEYLKNVLYRYMYSRENLGKEAVTLARVIGTVARFSKSEMDNVVTKEESRVAGWVGGTVSHVLTGR
ncbi:hypothetical protein V3C99_001537 [Haemonchus contortus]